MRSITILDCNIHSQITVAHVTLPKAVPSTVEIFAVYLCIIDPYVYSLKPWISIRNLKSLTEAIHI